MGTCCPHSYRRSEVSAIANMSCRLRRASKRFELPVGISHPLRANEWALGCFDPLLLFDGAFGFPIPRLGLTIPVKFHFPLDTVAANLAAVLRGSLVPVHFASHGEGDFIALELAIVDRDGLSFTALETRGGQGSRDFIPIDF